MSTSTPGAIPALAGSGQHPSLIGRIAQSMWAWYLAYAEERARYQTAKILSELDDRTLKDIGVHRSEIGSLVYGRKGERAWSR